MSELKEGDYATMFKLKQDDWIDACQEIDQLKSQLEREQKCVELAVEALEKIKNPEPLQYNWAVAENVLTKIKSLREQK